MISNIDASHFAAAASGAEEIKKILKKEEKKGKTSKVLQAIKDFHLAHEKVKEEIAKSLGEDTGIEIKSNSDLVDSAVFSLSLNKIFENRNGVEQLAPDLKQALQRFDSESLEAKAAVANKLSEGSKQKVPKDNKIVDQDIDEISQRTTSSPDILFS